MCEKVLSLVSHLKKNRQDTKAVRALQTALSHRKRQLELLKGTNYCHFAQIMRYYGMVDQGLAMVQSNFFCKNWR